MNEWDVRHYRHLPSECLVDLRLTGAIVEVIVAADDMGDTHVVVVYDDCKHICRGAVRTQQDEVVEVLVLPDHASLNLVVNDRFTCQRCLEADHRVNSGGYVLGVEITAAAVIEPCTTLGPRLLPHCCEFFLAAIATIGVAGAKQLLRDLTMTGGARELENDFAVPGEPEPR